MNWFLKFAVFMVGATLFSVRGIAQNEKTIDIDNDGVFHVSSPIKVGNRIVTKGMYHIYRIDKNTELFIVIRKVAMTYYGKTMGSMRLGDEVARLKCTIQRVAEENKKSKILFIRPVAKERLAIQAWFRREKTKCILPI